MVRYSAFPCSFQNTITYFPKSYWQLLEKLPKWLHGQLLLCKHMQVAEALDIIVAWWGLGEHADGRINRQTALCMGGTGLCSAGLSHSNLHKIYMYIRSLLQLQMKEYPLASGLFPSIPLWLVMLQPHTPRP